MGAYAGGRVASPTLLRHSRGLVRASLHAGPLLIPSSSRQEASTCPIHELRGRPLSRRHTGLSLLVLGYLLYVEINTIIVIQSYAWSFPLGGGVPFRATVLTKVQAKIAVIVISVYPRT